MSFFGPSDPMLLRSIIDGLREPIWEVAFSPRVVRDEDVRALALEHEEKRSLGLGAQTEADISPGKAES